MQQTSGSSFSNRPDGDETAVDEVAVATVVSFLLMFLRQLRSVVLLGTVGWFCFTVGFGVVSGKW